MENLYEVSNRLIREYGTRRFRRPLFNKLNPDSRLIEISGSRGVGKTTLMLQKAYEINLQYRGGPPISNWIGRKSDWLQGKKLQELWLKLSDQYN